MALKEFDAIGNRRSVITLSMSALIREDWPHKNKVNWYPITAFHKGSNIYIYIFKKLSVGGSKGKWVL